MREHGIWERLKRLVQMRLIVPLKRSPHPPEFSARGTAVGLAWAMTPLVGIQMWLVFMTWLFCKKVLKWEFSLPLGLAWTWITNVATLVPAYYGFYITGQFLRGQWDNLSGYDSLKHVICETFLGELTFGEKWSLILDLMVKEWGVSMLIGCLPWALICGVGGYYTTLAFVRRHQRIKAEKMRKSHAKGK